MGFLTTITIYNDSISEILNNKEEFAEKCYNACCSQESGTISLNGGSVGKHQIPRHSHDETIYIHSGNTLIELNPFSKETKRLSKYNPIWYKGMIRLMKFRYEELKKLI